MARYFGVFVSSSGMGTISCGMASSPTSMAILGGLGPAWPQIDGLHRGHCGWVEDDEKMRFIGLSDQLQDKIGIGRISG
jgi:hypothetical protein